jgi:hypothetical protein
MESFLKQLDRDGVAVSSINDFQELLKMHHIALDDEGNFQSFFFPPVEFHF